MAGGRPSKLTPEIIEDVRRILPIVLYVETVADYLGIYRKTIRNWLKRGRIEANRLAKTSAKPKASEELYHEFFLTYKKGLAEGDLYDLKIITEAAKMQWQAAAWRRERRAPDRWSRDRKLLLELVKKVSEIEQRADHRGEPVPAPESPGTTPQ